ncbi:hypothetical protein [Desertibacillus haloalkaliphilus]|nr:hypothetical protein [Desertibacillus haloalkaliphilus]
MAVYKKREFKLHYLTLVLEPWSDQAGSRFLGFKVIDGLKVTKG